MFAPEIVLTLPGVTFGEVRCDAHDARWSAEEPICNFALVLLRRGSFERRADGERHIADPLTAYVQRPGSVQRIAHRSAGDVSTVIAPSGDTLGVLAERALEVDALPMSPAAGLGHQMLIARARAGAETFELAERAIALAGMLIAAAVGDSPGVPRRPRASAQHRASVLADGVRDAIDDDIHLRLDELAVLLGAPAYELSRTFRRRTGETVSRYRLRVRLHRAISRIADGDSDLAGVAAEAGFADQGHLTRALHRETGWTPGAFRTFVSAASAGTWSGQGE